MLKLIRSLAAVGTMFAALASAQAQNYPDKPIRLIVAFVPGGATDTLARQLQNDLQEALGQPVVIENKAGAGGVVGTVFIGNNATNAAVNLGANVAWNLSGLNLTLGTGAATNNSLNLGAGGFVTNLATLAFAGTGGALNITNGGFFSVMTGSCGAISAFNSINGF